jgi:polyhydroxybutyrate depolymerase
MGPDAGSTGGQAAGGTAGGAADGGVPAGVQSDGCGKAITRPSPNTQQTMSVGGTSRTYLLDVPSGADNKAPLVLIFALHGANMTNTQVVGSFNFDTRSSGKAITVYPQGDETASGARWTSNEANWMYIQSLMTDLESRYCVDTSKVFLTGFSMGGGFTMDTACQKTNMFRAYATVEGYGPGGVSAATKPACTNASAKAPLLIIQGSTDTTVTPAMGQASLAFWTEKNGCSATTTTPMGAGFTSCMANQDCTSTFPVYYCTGTWQHTITSTAAGDVWAFFSSFK